MVKISEMNDYRKEFKSLSEVSDIMWGKNKT